MIACNEASAWISLYVDNELAPGEMALLERHLEDCGDCRNRFDQLRSVVDNIRAASPLYDPSDESLRKVNGIVVAEARMARRHRFLAIAAALFVLVSASVAYRLFRQSPDEFSDFAAAAHLRHVNGSTPLDLVTDRPELVSRWFVRRLPFEFKVPEYVNEPAGSKRYSLEGVRLLDYRNNEVAYLAYRMNQRQISLLVASSRGIVPQGGQTFRTGGVDFHFSSERGLRLITWTDRALSYAIVSDLDVTGAQSCVICHGSPADRGKIESLPH